MLRIKLVRSLIGQNPRNRATVAALGLRKMQQVVVKEDTPTIRGMVHHVKHMLSVEVVEGEAPKKSASKPSGKADNSKAVVAAAEESKPKATKKAKADVSVTEAPAEKPKRTTKAKKTEE